MKIRQCPRDSPIAPKGGGYGKEGREWGVLPRALMRLIAHKNISVHCSAIEVYQVHARARVCV